MNSYKVYKGFKDTEIKEEPTKCITFSPPKFTKYPNNFLKKFVDFFKETTDSEDSFIFASALQSASVALGKNVSIKFGNHEEYPLLWQVLLADSGKLRKSTALNFTKSIMNTCNMKDNISPNISSPESLFESMQDNPTQLMLINEMSAFFSNLEKNYMRGFKESLLEIYDLPLNYIKQRKDNKGEVKKIITENPYIALYGASVMDTFMQYLKETDMTGGLLPRMLFVYCEERSKPYIPLPEPKEEIPQNIKTDFKFLKGIKGHIKLDKNSDAYKIYEKKYYEIMDSVTKDSPNILGSFASRYTIYILKLALIIECCYLAEEKETDLKEIRRESMKWAVDLMDIYWQTVKQLLEGGKFTFTDFDRTYNKIMDILRQYPNGITQRDLIRKLNKNLKDIEPYLETLEERGEIDREITITSTNQKRKIIKLT